MASKEKELEIVELEILPEDDLLDAYYKTALKGIRKTDSMDFANFYFDVCNSGENRFYQKNIEKIQSTLFSDTQIIELDRFLYYSILFHSKYPTQHTIAILEYFFAV